MSGATDRKGERRLRPQGRVHPEVGKACQAVCDAAVAWYRAHGILDMDARARAKVLKALLVGQAGAEAVALLAAVDAYLDRAAEAMIKDMDAER